MTMIFENIRMAITSLLANKTRAMLTMLGIIIGISSVIAIKTVGNSLEISVSESMKSVGANNINVYLTERPVTVDDREDGTTFGIINQRMNIMESDFMTEDMIYGLIENFGDSIEAISSSLTYGTSFLTNGHNSAELNISGVSLGYFVAYPKKMVAGNIISTDDYTNKKQVVVVSDKFVKSYFGGNVEDALGKEINLSRGKRSDKFSIIGIYEYDASEYEYDIYGGDNSTEGFIPLSTAHELAHHNYYTYFEVVTKVGEQPDILAANIADYLNRFYRNNDSYMIEAFSMSSYLEIMSTMLKTITMAISIIAGIALLVGGIGVMNIMLVSITERTREIGTRKALGATGGSIRFQFITEAMIICLIGGAIGVLLGILMGSAAATLMECAAKPSISSIIGSLIFSMAIGVFFGYYPANKAAKMNPIDALRYE